MWRKEIIRAANAPATRGPVSAHGVRVGPLLLVTGQSGRRPGEEDGYLADPAEHARQTMDNVKAIVEAGGATMDDVIKRTVVVANVEVYGQMREVIDSYFPSPVASSTLRGSLIRDDMLVEVEVIALVPDAQP